MALIAAASELSNLHQRQNPIRAASELLDLAHTLDALRVEIQQILASDGSKTPTRRKQE